MSLASLARPALAGLVLLSLTGLAPAGDVEAGRAKAQACAVCHGPLGLSTAPDAPNLAGQPELYLAAQLRAYRSGARKHEVMGVMAKPLSDEDIANLAAWFAAIRVEAQPPN
ncbi:c-type cytochrome [Roseateles violae]|uniref:Cytochrome c n=1 Tax=Roseateles violae TaxID=3058042 RepID=A0ABT8DWE7_9BURK|nr:cytochrome c [Pelomonas sp. PFR6]MDN3922308.1 cytochrome c [Pelomonas sp. PFR6]